MIINATVFQSGSAEQLATPVITLETHTLTWSAIANATEYVIYKGSTLWGIISTTTITIDENGDYKIKAIASGYIDSGFSNTITILPLDVTGTTWQLNFTNSNASYNGYTPQGNLTGTISGHVKYSSDPYNMSYTRITRWSGQFAFAGETEYPCVVANSADWEHRSSGTGWSDCTDYPKITITGGTFATDGQFINWLIHKATQVS